MSEPRFTREKLDDALEGFCAQLGLDPAGARLVRFTNNAVYALAGAEVIVRIVASRRLRHRAHKAAAVARHLAACGVPAARLYGEMTQPLAHGEHLATVWQRIPETGRAPRMDELGALLAKVHALPVPADVPCWGPLDDVAARIADAEELAESDRRFLSDYCAAVRAELERLEFPSAPALLHGDAHLGNVLVGAQGPALCDFDSACVGPPEWDLVPVAVGAARFGDRIEDYRALAAALGRDVLNWSGFRALRAARELKLTTSALPILRSNPAVRPELYRRLADMRAGRVDARWARYH